MLPNYALHANVRANRGTAWLTAALLALAAPPATGTQAPGQVRDTISVGLPGESLSVYLLTVEPGDAVWEVFGHNALVVRDAATGIDVAFNYGMFSFDEPGYYRRFLQGEMMYWVEALPLAAMLRAYQADNRRIWAQELNLGPTETLELVRTLRSATLEENRYYPYQYFTNNCSTKLRDVLDAALQGQLREATNGLAAGATWRDHTRRLAARHALGYLGINLVLGPKGDEPISAWQEMWVPMKLRDRIGALFVTESNGSRTRFVLSEELWADSSRDPEPVAAPSLDGLFLLLGVGIGLVLLFFGYMAVAGSTPGRLFLAALGLGWATLCLAASGVMIGVHFTSHDFMYLNPNLLLFSPLGAAAGLSLVRVARKGRTSLWGRRFAICATALAVFTLVIALIPSWGSSNGEWLALALPVHVALCWVMLGIHKMDHALVYG